MLANARDSVQVTPQGLQIRWLLLTLHVAWSNVTSFAIVSENNQLWMRFIRPLRRFVIRRTDGRPLVIWDSIDSLSSLCATMESFQPKIT